MDATSVKGFVYAPMQMYTFYHCIVTQPVAIYLAFSKISLVHTFLFSAHHPSPTAMNVSFSWFRGELNGKKSVPYHQKCISVRNYYT